MVPNSPLWWPAARRIESSRKLVVVLPLVPVIPISASFSAGRPKKFAPIVASAFRASATRIQTTPGGIAGGFAAPLAAAAPACENSASHAGPGGGGNSLTIAHAPRSRALDDKAISVGDFAFDGHEQRARRDAAAVVGDGGNFNVWAGRKFQRARTDQ